MLNSLGNTVLKKTLASGAPKVLNTVGAIIDVWNSIAPAAIPETKIAISIIINLVAMLGLEPRTSALWMLRSNQLSYIAIAEGNYK